MKRLIIGIIAAITIPLATAPVAGADGNDDEFIKSTDEVIMLHTASDPDGHWVGYPDVPAQIRIDTAHGVCDLLDGGAAHANDFIVTALSDDRRYASYLAAWFQQIAIVHYCPRHSDKIGTI